MTSARFLHRAQRMLKDNTDPATVCRPCCDLAKDTEISAAVPPDYGAASLTFWILRSHVTHFAAVIGCRSTQVHPICKSVLAHRTRNKRRVIHFIYFIGLFSCTLLTFMMALFILPAWKRNKLRPSSRRSTTSHVSLPWLVVCLFFFCVQRHFCLSCSFIMPFWESEN